MPMLKGEVKMTVDLGDYIDNLKGSISAPGADAFPAASDDDYVTRLQNGFWGAFVDGIVKNWTESDGIVTPVNPSGLDMSRDFIQIVIFYAAADIITSQLRALQTTFRATAGSVSYETQYSANVLNALLQDIKERRLRIIYRYVLDGSLMQDVFDAVQARTDSIDFQDTWFVSGGSDRNLGWPSYGGTY